MKNRTIATILAATFGGLGIDRFYLGYTGLGVLKLLTAGCFGILWIIDLINIANGSLLPADGTPYEDMPGAAAAPSVDPYAELAKLAQLRDQGILTPEEYERMKADCMAKMR